MYVAVRVEFPKSTIIESWLSIIGCLETDWFFSGVKSATLSCEVNLKQLNKISTNTIAVVLILFPLKF